MTRLASRSHAALPAPTLARWAAGVLLPALLALLCAPRPAAAQPAADCPPAPVPPSAAQVQQAQREARDRGFLWRIERDGRVGYLFGTLHVGRLAWALPGPQLAQALQATDTLALELDPSDASAAGALTAPAAGGAALPPPLAARLARARAAACMGDALAGAHPLLQAVTVGLLEARRDGLEPGYGQEAMLTELARALGHRVVALETVEQQLRALIPADADEAQRSLAIALDQLEGPTARRVLRRTAQVWAESRHDELLAWRDWCECVATETERAQLHRLLDERNPAMAERIDALHRQGRRVLAAVGALHMAGPQGLPTLLTQRGYTVQRIAFDPK